MKIQLFAIVLFGLLMWGAVFLRLQSGAVERRRPVVRVYDSGLKTDLRGARNRSGAVKRDVEGVKDARTVKDAKTVKRDNGGVKKQKIVIVIPFRDRDVHYEKIAKHLPTITRPNWDLHTILVEQDDTEHFRRAWLMNIGIYEAKKRFKDESTCVVTHDIDMISDSKVDYGWCDKPTQICSELSCFGGSVPYKASAGGVVQASLKDWFRINGFTNEAIGWGGEDDDLHHRFRLNRLLTNGHLRRPAKGFGKCHCMHDDDHTERKTHPAGYKKIVSKILRMERGSDEWKRDGLNSLKYYVHSEVKDDYGTIRLRVGRERKDDKDSVTISGKQIHFKYERSLTKWSGVIYGVLSGNRMRSRRDSVRTTWCKNKQCAFIVGGKFDDVRGEFYKYKDILWLNADEVYFGDTSVLPYKTQLFFYVASTNIKGATFVVKTDDDSFIRTEDLELKLERTRPDYWGHVFRNAQVNRQKNHKWYVSKQQYSQSTFPDYCSGAGYAFSMRTLNCIEKSLSTFPYMPREDVASGMLALKCNIKPTDAGNQIDILGTSINKNVIIKHYVKTSDAMQKLSHVANDQCEKYDLTNFHKAKYWFKGVGGKQIPFVAGVHGECDLLNNQCDKIQNGYVLAPDRWMMALFEVIFDTPCINCVGLDFGSNVGLVSLTMMQENLDVIAVEPQVDLCCAARRSALHMGSKYMSYCGGVAVNEQKSTLQICDKNPGYRDGWTVNQKDMRKLFDSLGLPHCYNAPLYQLSSIMAKIPSGKQIKIAKIDTDSIDCSVARHLLDGPWDIETFTLETWAQDLCNQRDDFLKLISDFQQRGYDIYHTPAQPAAYNENHAYKTIVSSIVSISSVKIWKLHKLNAMKSTDKSRLFDLRKKYQMLMTRVRLEPSNTEIFSFWHNVNGAVLPDIYHRIMAMNCKHHPKPYKFKIYSNTLPMNTFDSQKECDIEIVRFDASLFYDTPITTNVYKNVASTLDTVPQLMSDLLRLVLIYKFGGIWIDMDNIFLHQVPKSWNRMFVMGYDVGIGGARVDAGEESFITDTIYNPPTRVSHDFSIGNGFISVKNKHDKFLLQMLNQVAENFNPSCYACIGSQLFVQSYKKYRPRLQFIDSRLIAGCIPFREKNCVRDEYTKNRPRRNYANTNLALHIFKNQYVVPGSYIDSILPKLHIKQMSKISPDDGYNYMYGYYDKHQVDASNKRVIVIRIPFYNKEPRPTDVATVGWVDDSRVFHQISTTSAWNLQQGSMAEWISPTSVVFNIRENDSFHGVLYTTSNFNEWTLQKTYKRPIYAWDHVHMRFASISFARLHNLRRGYGYTVALTKIPKCPDDDGIWINDDLIFSYSKLRSFIINAGNKDVHTGLMYKDNVPQNINMYWWVNHIMWSSDGNLISFILRASSELHGHSYQFSTLIMANVETKELWRVPLLRGSHPFHHDTLLNCEDKGSFDIKFKTYVKQLPWQRGVDGHCSKHPKREAYLTDTYPRPSKDLLIFDHDNTKHNLGTFLPGNEGPVFTRCDLHPRWSTNGDYVLFDSTHIGGKRAVYKTFVPQKTCSNIFIDWGANIGMHARFLFEPDKYDSTGRAALEKMYRLFNKHFGKQRSNVCVFGVEANVKRCSRLQRLADAYGKRGWHIDYTCPKAVWDQETTLAFKDQDGIGDGTASRIDQNSNTRVATVSGATYVESLIEKYTPDVLVMKMDIEGAEYTVLPELERRGLLCTDNHGIDVITLEYHSRFMNVPKDWSVPETYPCNRKTNIIELDSEDYVKDGIPI